MLSVGRVSAVKSAPFFMPFRQKQVLKYIKLAGCNENNYKYFRKLLILCKLQNENNLHFP